MVIWRNEKVCREQTEKEKWTYYGLDVGSTNFTSNITDDERCDVTSKTESAMQFPRWTCCILTTTTEMSPDWVVGEADAQWVQHFVSSFTLHVDVVQRLNKRIHRVSTKPLPANATNISQMSNKHHTSPTSWRPSYQRTLSFMNVFIFFRFIALMSLISTH